jgi:MoaA/NifB/PqqE/SkfB family radical SAM enzyme
VIDPSNTCRLACPGCVHSARSEELKRFDWPDGTLSEYRLSALLRVYGPHAVGVYFCNYGEPLLNLKTPQLIRMAKCYLMSTALSTSLSVRRFDPKAYVESGLDMMALSIDGATQPVTAVRLKLEENQLVGVFV